MVIVGDINLAPERLWTTLCQATQWTALTEAIVENLSITPSGQGSARSHLIDVPDDFPMRICDQHLPNSNSGFVYLLISTRCPEQSYVGTTANLAVRINKHNSGYGSIGTACTDYMPWAVAAYMTNMAHMDESSRMSIESEWQELNSRSVANHQVTDVEQFIENGRRVFNRYNESQAEHPEFLLNYVICAQRRYALELVEDDDSTDPMDEE